MRAGLHRSVIVLSGNETTERRDSSGLLVREEIGLRERGEVLFCPSCLLVSLIPLYFSPSRYFCLERVSVILLKKKVG